MGRFVHHAIVVTTGMHQHDEIEQARAYVQGLTSIRISEIVKSPINGFESIFIAPDGSNDGWAQSASGNYDRDLVIDKLTELHLPWVEIEYGEIEEGARISRAYYWREHDE